MEQPSNPPAPETANPAPGLAAGSRREALLARLDADGRYPTWVLLAALAGMFATSFPITILAVSLASIAGEFSADETTMAWVISAPMLLSAVSFPLLGKLGDQRGHRRVKADLPQPVYPLLHGTHTLLNGCQQCLAGSRLLQGLNGDAIFLIAPEIDCKTERKQN